VYVPVQGVIAVVLLQACSRSTWHIVVFFSIRSCPAEFV